MNKVKFKNKSVKQLYKLLYEIAKKAETSPDLYEEIYFKLMNAVDEAEKVGLIKYEEIME